MIKVLHVITGLGNGGAERSLFNLVTSRQSGIRHSVISLSGMGSYGLLIKDAGIPIEAVGIRSFSTAVGAISRLRALVRQVVPDVLQGWMYHGNLATSLARQPGIPVAWNIRQSLPDIHEEKFGTRAAIKAGCVFSKRVNRTVYNSFVAKEHHEALGYVSENSVVIPNGFDTQRWRPNAFARNKIRAELELPPKAPVLGFVGRNHPVKDLPTLLISLKTLMAENPSLYVVIAGEGTGPESPALACHYAVLPMERLRCIGIRFDVPDLMACFDIFCICSRAEAFPNVLGEAMATGLPCVSTDVGDCREILGNTGLLVPASNPLRLNEALNSLLAMHDLDRITLGKAARVRIENRFSIQKTMCLYAHIYQELADTRAC